MTPSAPALLLAAALASLAFPQEAGANGLTKVLPLESYEPNTMGWTNDSDDVGFLDFKLSVKYPVMPERICKSLPNSRAYFAATARFAQYLGTRESSPVVGKRFNPKLIWRQVTTWDAQPPEEHGCRDNEHQSVREHVDFALGHESNGQSINSEAKFLEAQALAEQPDFAKDYISRGWDYLELATKHSPLLPGKDKLTIYPSIRIFLRHGPLQGPAEEYNEWEQDPEGKPRRKVHGLAVLAKYQIPFAYGWLGDIKLALGYETGYSSPFRYNTVRVDAGIKVLELPVMVFYQQGYGNDLALYYKRGSSVGFALEIAGF